MQKVYTPPHFLKTNPLFHNDKLVSLMTCFGYASSFPWGEISQWPSAERI